MLPAQKIAAFAGASGTKPSEKPEKEPSARKFVLSCIGLGYCPFGCVRVRPDAAQVFQAGYSRLYLTGEITSPLQINPDRSRRIA
jgi:hypothetical protein